MNSSRPSAMTNHSPQNAALRGASGVFRLGRRLILVLLAAVVFLAAASPTRAQNIAPKTEPSKKFPGGTKRTMVDNGETVVTETSKDGKTWEVTRTHTSGGHLITSKTLTEPSEKFPGGTKTTWDQDDRTEVFERNKDRTIEETTTTHNDHSKTVDIFKKNNDGTYTNTHDKTDKDKHTVERSRIDSSDRFGFDATSRSDESWEYDKDGRQTQHVKTEEKNGGEANGTIETTTYADNKDRKGKTLKKKIHWYGEGKTWVDDFGIPVEGVGHGGGLIVKPRKSAEDKPKTEEGTKTPPKKEEPAKEEEGTKKVPAPVPTPPQATPAPKKEGEKKEEAPPKGGSATEEEERKEIGKKEGPDKNGIPVSLFGDYAYMRPGGEEVKNLNGWRAGLAVQVSERVSVGADFTDGYGSSSIDPPGGPAVKTNLHRQTYMAGVQVDILPKTWQTDLRPGLTRQWNAFVEAELGAAHDSNRISFGGMTNSSSATAFAMKFGGGLDRDINEHFGVRLFQFDYQPTHFGGAWQNNFGVSTGLVVHFGGNRWTHVSNSIN